MNDNVLTPEKHKEQIEAYRNVIGHYKAYADTLRRVLWNACAGAFPEAMVQAREKTLSSFAEKVARKFHKYKNPVNELTDLCAARVIVQTLEQVKAVCRFVEANFEIVQRDDKGLLLGSSTFGYRDMHYLVRLRPERDSALGITAQERETLYGLKNRTAEIQVRTWLQHAWADSTHDRLYKSSLSFSSEIVRSGNLLAAEMERGDRGFNQLVGQLDGMIANYTKFASKAEVEKEIGLQELIFENEPDPAKKPGLALKLARLCASYGKDDQVVRLLEPYADVCDSNLCEALLLLGGSLCRMHAAAPALHAYGTGLDFLIKSVELCENHVAAYVQDLRKHESLHARALSRLGRALEKVPGEEHRACVCYQKAHGHEPENPYYLAEMLGAELRSSGCRIELIESLQPIIRVAIATCEEHARMAVELPSAYFAAGRLSHLLEEAAEVSAGGSGATGWNGALGWYARGIQYLLEGNYCVAPDALGNESEWLQRMHDGKRPTAACQHILDLLDLARNVSDGLRPKPASAPIVAPVLIVAGGAEAGDVRPLLLEGLAAFRGTVVSGGATAGVRGCVGDVAGQLAVEGRKNFRLVAYRTDRFQEDSMPDTPYDADAERACCPERILRNWQDIAAAGIDPRTVLLLGFGGGAQSALEYRIALGLGASVGIVSGTGGAANALLRDPVWTALPSLLPLVKDPMTVRAFVAPEGGRFDADVLEEMAKEFHARFVGDNTKGLPEKLKPWPQLKETFKNANLNEAAYAVRILEGVGFAVRKSAAPVILDHQKFAPEELERMAEMEHGRWVMERLRDGWRYGPRDDGKKLHNCLVPWAELPDGPEGVRKYDRDSVCAFPHILAKAGLEVYRA